MVTLGNKDILRYYKTAFLCSRRYPSWVVTKSYDWAIAQRKASNCVISGFHSQIEKDVFRFLVKGTQPIIVAMARGLPRRIDKDLKACLEKGRLLIVSPFPVPVTRITADTCRERNRFMLDLADELMLYAGQGSSLERLLDGCSKPVLRIENT